MVITHHGLFMFKVSFGDTTLCFGPVGKDSAYKPTRFGADVALIPFEHPDASGAESVALGDRQPFVVNGPGEYEVRDVLIKGYPTKSMYGGEERINTVYLVRLENMLMLYLGALGSKELPHELKEQLDEVDILFIPIGGKGMLEPDEAHALAVSIESKIVIPMGFVGVGQKDALNLFLKEDAKDNGAPQERLTLKRKDLEGRNNDVVVLES